MFYPSSDVDNGVMRTHWHEGDWEMFQFAVRIRDDDSLSDKSRWLQPYAGTASQHYWGQTLKWEDAPGDAPVTSQNQDYIEKNGFRPVVYVALGTHATYFRSGEFNAPLARGIAGTQHQYAARDDTFGEDNTAPSQAAAYGYALRHIEEESQMVKTWKGHWGETNTDPSTEGPRSPFYRGNGYESDGGGFIYMLRDPKGFHNAYLKTAQSTTHVIV